MNVHSPVELHVDTCIADAAEVRNVVRVELGELLTDEPDARGDHAHASIGCDGAVAVLRVDDPITHHSLWRRIPLGDDATQPRLLALALVELLAASWADEEPAPLPAPAPPPALALPPLHIEPRAERYAIFTTGGSWFSAGSQLLVGPGMRVASNVHQLGWMIDAQFRAGTTTTSAGTLQTDTLALAAAAALHVTGGPVRFDIGAGLRGGEVRMAGTPATMGEHGSSFWSPWCGAFVIGTATLPINDRIAATLSAEGGHVLAPVTALVDGQPAAAIAGAWLQIDLGFGFSL